MSVNGTGSGVLKKVLQNNKRPMIKVYNILYFICMFWRHHSMVEPVSSNIRLYTGVRKSRFFPPFIKGLKSMNGIIKHDIYQL